jgi:hypothetical protein
MLTVVLVVVLAAAVVVVVLDVVVVAAFVVVVDEDEGLPPPPQAATRTAAATAAHSHRTRLIIWNSFLVAPREPWPAPLRVATFYRTRMTTGEIAKRIDDRTRSVPNRSPLSDAPHRAKCPPA